MSSLGLSFFIMGLVVASVTAMETSTGPGFSTTSNDSYTTGTPLNTTYTINVTRTTDTTYRSPPSTITSNSTESNSTESNSTTPYSTTKQEGGESTEEMVTPKPTYPPKTTRPATKVKEKTTTAKPKTAAATDSIGIIILVVIVLVVVTFGITCFFTRRRRRYSVVFTSRADEANIPLGTMDPELPVDSVPQNGLQTFVSTEPTTKEPKEPEAKPEVQKEQAAEADKSLVDLSAESAAPVPSPDGSEDKPKEDVVEQSPPAPVQLSVEEKTDDEGVVSNKTSVESLKETNENNSNNADFSQKRDLMWSNNFRDVPLDCQV